MVNMKRSVSKSALPILGNECRKTNRRKTSKRKYGGTTLKKKTNLRRAVRKTRRSPSDQTRPVAKPPSELVVEGIMPSDQTRPVVLGKIYSEQCIHCQNMSDAWEEMKKDLPVNYTVWDIESKDEESKKKDFQQKHGVQLQSAGYPTIFMIVQGKQVDYNGSRDKDNLLQWATHTQ